MTIGGQNSRKYDVCMKGAPSISIRGPRIYGVVVNKLSGCRDAKAVNGNVEKRTEPKAQMNAVGQSLHDGVALVG